MKGLDLFALLTRNITAVSLVAFHLSTTSESKRLIPRHRMFSNRELDACRLVNGGQFFNYLNPGIRVQTDFVNKNDAIELVECVNSIKSQFGFSTSEGGELMAVVDDEIYASGIIDRSHRVTGRPELSTSTQAPWGYGDAFKRESVPEVLLNLASKIENDPNFGLKAQSLRDITINYLEQGLFRFDPHRDHPSDGSNVFIVGLQSDVVMTFTPPDAETGLKLSLEAGKPYIGCREREPPRTGNDAEISFNSWTDDDIDVLFKENSLVHFTGDARSVWQYAIRMGLYHKPSGCVVDWHGDRNNIVKRNSDRISIAFGFE